MPFMSVITAWLQAEGAILSPSPHMQAWMGADSESIPPARELLQDQPPSAQVTEVMTAQQLQDAVARGDPHIEVKSHMDLTTISPLDSSYYSGYPTHLGVMEGASVKSIRVQFSPLQHACVPASQSMPENFVTSSPWWSLPVAIRLELHALCHASTHVCRATAMVPAHPKHLLASVTSPSSHCFLVSVSF